MTRLFCQAQRDVELEIREEGTQIARRYPCGAGRFRWLTQSTALAAGTLAVIWVGPGSADHAALAQDVASGETVVLDQITVEARRRETATDRSIPPEHAIGFRVTSRF